tara:strand:+ start:10213 stop:10578 length:366 start_codon:yes stop_codon:yes gene_type:complete
MKLVSGLVGLALLGMPAIAMADEDKPEVKHCMRMAHSMKSHDFAKFGVQVKRYRNIAGMIRVNLAYAGIDADGAGTTGSFECRFRSTEVRAGTLNAATVFIDRGRLTKDALAKYNALASGS